MTDHHRRPLTLFTGQWADLPLEDLCRKAKAFGYDGLELACAGDHFDVARAVADPGYVKRQWDVLQSHGLGAFAISNHLVGQAVCDAIDERHRAILPARIWGDGVPEGVRRRAAAEMKDTARAARRFFDAAPEAVRAVLKRTGRTVVVGFTGSPIWPMAYAFPPTPQAMIDRGYEDFGRRFGDILATFDEVGVSFALEVHPTEIAFDIPTAHRALFALGGHRRFGFNFDPSHFAYQGVDYLEFVRSFHGRIWNVHVKDVWWSDAPASSGVFGGHLDFGASGRYWDFRSPGRGRIDFEGIVRELNRAAYAGPLSVEWEDSAMDRDWGAGEAAAFVRKLDFKAGGSSFEAAFATSKP